MRWWRAVQDCVVARASAPRLTEAKRRRAASPDGERSGIGRARVVLDHRCLLRLDEQWAKLRGGSGADAERRLTSLQCQVIYWGRRGRTIAQIASRLARPLDEVVAAV